MRFFKSLRNLLHEIWSLSNEAMDITQIEVIFAKPTPSQSALSTTTQQLTSSKYDFSNIASLLEYIKLKKAVC